MVWLLVFWFLLGWFLLSVPLSVLLGRCIAAGQSGPGGASVLGGAGAQSVPPGVVPVGWR